MDVALWKPVSVEAVEKEKINILIADDHPAVRYGMRSVLQLEPSLNVVGEASNSDEVFTMLSSAPIDLIIVDIRMPGTDGVETVRRVRAAYPSIKLLGFSIYEYQYRVIGMLRAGADGYLLKSADSNEIIVAISTVMKGEKYISKEVADKVIYNTLSAEEAPELYAPMEALSEREEEVLRMLTRGNSYNDIASLLQISRRTVDTHRYNISKKLGIKTVAGLIRYAINIGLD